jgi:hypothetical protein
VSPIIDDARDGERQVCLLMVAGVRNNREPEAWRLPHAREGEPGRESGSRRERTPTHSIPCCSSNWRFVRMC